MKNFYITILEKGVSLRQVNSSTCGMDWIWDVVEYTIEDMRVSDTGPNYRVMVF